MPYSIASIVMQCLGKDPSERPRSASDIVSALESRSGTPPALPLLVPAAASPSAAIAVLPFTNMSGDPDNEYFSDGITDDIIMALTQVKALRVAAHEEALAMDPNAVIHLWMAALRLSDFGRAAEALPLVSRAVELTQRGPLVLGMLGRTYALAGRIDDARAVRQELRERAQHEYIGPAARLMQVGLDMEDEEATAALIRENVDAMTGPTAIVTTVARELEPLLDHPRLGPLVGQLTLWATAPEAYSANRSARP